ncbi:hypothetical protein FOB58_003334 [Candida parapsilosis]|uniref:Uncharacterized protein n=2 Tax=Candida parapsilosis TaxID=5480 RepID=G8B6B5_CANPC|nr:uncharacterized protein CPAR2_100350 [Candida parapsilosis]KAF6047976.1 hypothetical protein FOB59_003019 [Candida parapsilosis]KAF6050057.1 hypothetical protein FOB58_003334 [Candida parapsilosis]KAF6057920.1 hypothetical protein FOB60_002475 [Candida parapsilosis]KAF6065373.1 hypothetical protein FOB61_001443 [Candida parapsilosis]CCE39996.1 hypothetical protein CPAR2_100350 [Candida parapsilosis]
MFQPPAKFIDLVSEPINTTEWPLPQVDNTIPKFNYEVITVSKQVSQILVHQLKTTSIEIGLHPKFASVIVSEKYFVNANYKTVKAAKSWNSYLDYIASGQVCQPIKPPPFNLQRMPHREFAFLEEPISECAVEPLHATKPIQLNPTLNSIFVPTPVILQLPQVPKEPTIKVWDTNDKISLFDIIEQRIDSKLPPLERDFGTLLPHQLNLVNRYSIGIDCATIFPNKSDDQIFQFQLANWGAPSLTHHFNTHDLNMFLFEREITRSRKYMVQPTATANPKQDKPAEYFLQLYLDKRFNNKSWHLNKYQLIVEMEWKPITADIKTLQSQFLEEVLDAKIDPSIEPITTAHDIKLNPFVVENTFVLDYPQLQEQTTTTARPDVDNGATNLATYHDDTEALVHLVATKKRKLNTKEVDIPQELALLSFLHPKKEARKEEDKEKAPENTSTESKIPQYSVFFDSSFNESTKEYQFPPKQYIALSQSFWNKDYTLAKSLSEKISVLEVKFSHAVDIVINTTSAIYITAADLLIQGDGKSTNFLILKEVLTMKQHFHKLYIVAVVNTASFVANAGIKLQTLQLICLGLNIKLLFVSNEDALLWLLEIIESEPPQFVDEPVDLDNQQYGLLCECGLTYFQAQEILQRTSLEAFISSSVDEKLKKFKELVTPELLKSVRRVLV